MNLQSYVGHMCDGSISCIEYGFEKTHKNMSMKTSLFSKHPLMKTPIDEKHVDENTHWWIHLETHMDIVEEFLEITKAVSCRQQLFN